MDSVEGKGQGHSQAMVFRIFIGRPSANFAGTDRDESDELAVSRTVGRSEKCGDSAEDG